MIKKLNELKNQTTSNDVKNLCEEALSTIDSAIYNGVTPDAKYEIEKMVMTNLFEKLSKVKDDSLVTEWLSNQERLFTVKNLGVREAVNNLNENKELREILEKFKDALDQDVPEVRLYEAFVTALSPFGYFPTVGNAIQAVSDRVEKYKTDVDIKKILETMKETRSNYLVPLIEDVVNNYLADKNAESKNQLTQTLMKFTYDPFVRDIASIVTLDATDLQLEYANAECDIEKVYSPVLYLRENEAVFSVNNVFYVKKGNNVSRLPQVDILQLDEEFKSLCETLSNPNVIVEKKGITIYFKNDKAVINKDGVEVNGQQMNEEQFGNAVEVSNMSGNRDFFALTEFVRSNFMEIGEVDFVKRVYLKENANQAADIFKLRDNLFITLHKPELGKSTFYRNVNPMQAKNLMMEHLRYDISSLVENLLPDEEKIIAQINETKESYNTYIEELNVKINEFKSSTFGKETNDEVVIALQEELKEVKNEYKDYLNHVEKYMRAPESLDEEIVLNLKVDDKTYTIPIPQEVKDIGDTEGEENAGTVVGSENVEDEPASAVTFDDDQTELLGDTPTIPDDQIDLGSEEIEDDAEQAEIDAEEEKAEQEAETEEEGDEIKIEDEVDLDVEDEAELKDEDEEEEKKKKESPLESSEGGKKLKKSKFIREGGEEDIKEAGEPPVKKKKKVFLKKKITESVSAKTKFKLNEAVSDEEAEGAERIDVANNVFINRYQLRDGRIIDVGPDGSITNEYPNAAAVPNDDVLTPINPGDIDPEGSVQIEGGNDLANRYRLRDGRIIDVMPDNSIRLVNDADIVQGEEFAVTPEEAEGAERVEGGDDTFSNRYRLRDGRIIDVMADSTIRLVNEN